MFDNVGKTNDEEATTRSLVAVGSILALLLLVWAGVVLYGVIRITEEITGQDILDEDMVEIIMEEDAGLEAPPPPPPPPPPPAASPEPEEEEPEEDEETEPEPDEMVEEVAELDEDIEEEQKTAKRPAGEEGGVEGGQEGGEVGGVLGGVVGGVVGGQLGGVRQVHHSEVKTKRRVMPRYPEAARTANLGDQNCRLRVFIDEKGKPYDVKFMACPKVFQPSAEKALFKWRWYPAKDENGNKTRATFGLNIRYTLN